MASYLDSLIATQPVPNSLPQSAMADYAMDYDDDDFGDDDEDLFGDDLYGDEDDDEDLFGDDDDDDEDLFGDDFDDDDDYGFLPIAAAAAAATAAGRGGRRTRYARLATRYTRSMQKGKTNRAARLMSRMQKLWSKMRPNKKVGLDSPSAVAQKAGGVSSAMSQQPAAVQQAYQTSNYARRVREGRQTPRRRGGRRFRRRGQSLRSDMPRMQRWKLQNIAQNPKRGAQTRAAAQSELNLRNKYRRGGGGRTQVQTQTQSRVGPGGRRQFRTRSRGRRGGQVQGPGYPQYTPTSGLFGVEPQADTFWSKTMGEQPFMSLLVAGGIFVAGAYVGRERLKNIL